MDTQTREGAIAFCTPVMNRLWQLRQTLARNLECIENTPHYIALCNYNSTDQLDEYIKENFFDQISNGKLVYFYTTQPLSFHMSKAKNLAHRLGLRFKPHILFSLDADNFVSRKSIKIIESEFQTSSKKIIHEWSLTWGDGSSGRVALTADNWQRLGGYDESFHPFGYEEIDLLMRSRCLDLEYVLSSGSDASAIQNDMAQRFERIRDDQSTESSPDVKFDYYNRANMVMAWSRPSFSAISLQEKVAGVLNFTDQVTF